MKCFSEMEFCTMSGEFYFVKGGLSKMASLIDRKVALVEFSSLPVRKVLHELVELFVGYSPYHGVPAGKDQDRIRFEAHHTTISCPSNVAKMIEPHVFLPVSQWDLNDWETVDKYPRQTLVKSITQQAKAEILKFTRSAAGTQPSASGSQAKATGPSGSLRRRQNPKRSQPAFMLPVIRNTLPESASAFQLAVRGHS